VAENEQAKKIGFEWNPGTSTVPVLRSQKPDFNKCRAVAAASVGFGKRIWWSCFEVCSSGRMARNVIWSGFHRFVLRGKTVDLCVYIEGFCVFRFGLRRADVFKLS